TAPATPAPAVPTLEQLEAFDYTQTGIVWPATGTVSAPDLPYFAANGVPTTILASTDLAGAVGVGVGEGVGVEVIVGVGVAVKFAG
ncbi:hypothetical protein ACC691_39905, partial [Rhizobium johnstonii]|uniref:hypothetical protein n=1 Tax=Rhizobium johnstonii TaxID=3019933 RepID=UPI003F96A39D